MALYGLQYRSASLVREGGSTPQVDHSIVGYIPMTSHAIPHSPILGGPTCRFLTEVPTFYHIFIISPHLWSKVSRQETPNSVGGVGG